jgi:hypothetical protein
VTLYVTPVFYTYLDELQGWMGRVFNRAATTAPVPIPAPAAGDD